MVFGFITNFISSISSRAQGGGGGSIISPPKFAQSARNKNLLRPSSSLQEFSSYSQVDIEDPNIAATLTHSKPPPHTLLREAASPSSFSKEKAIPAGGGALALRNKCVRGFMFLCCVLLVGLLVYLVSMLVYSYWFRGEPKYYVVLDCGSTGTRVYVYQASVENEKGNSFPIVMKSLNEGINRKPPDAHVGRAFNRMETEPGLDKLVHNASGLKAALKPLVQWAEKQIPKKAHKKTSLFLYATAGVRRLPSNDSKWLLDHAWSILKKSLFRCEKDWVKTISGLEEAYFGWIALNHHRGMFGAGPKKPTFGSLDLGGSSLQVTFESNEHVQQDTSLNIRIGTVIHQLTAYSLAGYGLNDAFDKSVARIFQRLLEVNKTELVNGKEDLKHPCLQTGYKEQYICSQCVSKIQEDGTVVPKRNLGNGGRSGVPLTLVGAPNWDQCSKLARVAVNLSEWSSKAPAMDCDVQPCALSDNLPRPSGNFYAISGFFVVYRFFNLTADSSLEDVLEKGRLFCEKNWEVAKTSVAPQPFIEQYCFRAPYIAFLLREGLHIIDNQITIGSGSITWTQGVALLQAGKSLPIGLGFRNYEIFQMKINPIFLLLFLFISLILLVCALSCIGNWLPKLFWRPYLPLFMSSNASSASVIQSPFRFQRWSPIIPGDGRVKTPLSPTVAGSVQQRPFGFGHGLNDSGGIQLMESSLYPSSSSISHSYSSSSLGQMQYDSSSMGSFWTPHRSKMRLQSRRSQSREDLSSSLADAHMTKGSVDLLTRLREHGIRDRAHQELFNIRDRDISWYHNYFERFQYLQSLLPIGPADLLCAIHEASSAESD